LPTRRIVLAAPLLLAAAPEHVPEPRGIWRGPVHGPVPATLSGAVVLDTPALRRLIATHHPVLIDVARAQVRPPHMAPDMPWLPLPHRDIPGSVWLPGAGKGDPPAGLVEAYRARLAALTGGDRDRWVVVYCHPRCWESWNAAKRAVLFGHRHVAWYPGGIEAWQAARLPTQIARPESLGGGAAPANPGVTASDPP